MATILVVDGTGLIGAPVARQLQAAGHAVRVLTRNPEPAQTRFSPGFDVRGGDVEDPRDLGMPQITYLSGATVDPRNAWLRSTRDNLQPSTSRSNGPGRSARRGSVLPSAIWSKSSLRSSCF